MVFSNYFPNWIEADTVLPHVVAAFPYIEVYHIAWAETVRNISITLGIPPNSTASVPPGERRVLDVIVTEFLKSLITKETNEVIRHALERHVGRPDTPAEVRRIETEIKTDVNDILNDRVREYGVSIQDALRGWLGIPPYHLRIPERIHRHLVTVITLTGLDLAENEEVPFTWLEG